jgi:hypothetical protein
MNKFRNNVSPTWRGILYVMLLALAMAWIGAVTALQCTGQNFVQVYQGDNNSQFAFAVTQKKVWVQPLNSPGEPTITYTVVDKALDPISGEQFVRMVGDKDGHVYSLLANRFNAVLCSKWGNTWYWTDMGLESQDSCGYEDPEPREVPTKKGVSESTIEWPVCDSSLITWGWTEDGSQLIHLYQQPEGKFLVTWSNPGKPVHKTIANIEAISSLETGVTVLYKDGSAIGYIFPKDATPWAR